MNERMNEQTKTNYTGDWILRNSLTLFDMGGGGGDDGPPKMFLNTMLKHFGVGSWNYGALKTCFLVS